MKTVCPIIQTMIGQTNGDSMLYHTDNDRTKLYGRTMIGQKNGDIMSYHTDDDTVILFDNI